MANKEDSDSDIDDIVEKFGDFCECTDLVKRDRTKFTTKACNKLVQDALKKDYGKLEVSQRVDSSVFPVCKPKTAKEMIVNKDNVKKFVNKTAHEMAKKKTKNEKLKEDDPEVKNIKKHIKKCIRENAPHSDSTKVVKVGGVDRLTDTKGYTGSHKERFTAEGKGKGKEGREDIHANDGFVGGFKGKGTYDQRKK